MAGIQPADGQELPGALQLALRKSGTPSWWRFSADQPIGPQLSAAWCESGTAFCIRRSQEPPGSVQLKEFWRSNFGAPCFPLLGQQIPLHLPAQQPQPVRADGNKSPLGDLALFRMSACQATPERWRGAYTRWPAQGIGPASKQPSSDSSPAATIPVQRQVAAPGQFSQSPHANTLRDMRESNPLRDSIMASLRASSPVILVTAFSRAFLRWIAHQRRHILADVRFEQIVQPRLTQVL